MSWELFKRNILKYSNNPEAITDINQVAKFYAREYDMAIKRGYDSVNFVTMQRGNVIIMEKLFKLALKSGGLATSPYNLVGNMGKGVIAYWTGGIMNQLPIPIMPAPGSISNVSVVSNTVINPGVWLSKLPTTLKPTNQTELIIVNEEFTFKKLCNTIIEIKFMFNNYFCCITNLRYLIFFYTTIIITFSYNLIK